MTQAMILAAGLSTRLRPLTDKIPKPLLPFWDRTLLDFTLAYLESASIQSAAVNVHHGKDPFLKEIALSSQLTPFPEDLLLGTGGGIKNMRSFIESDTFVVLNCDFLSDIDLKKAIRFHIEKGALATMVLTKLPSAGSYKKIGIAKDGRIVHFPYGNARGATTTWGMFSGIHIFQKEIFQSMPMEAIFDINQQVYPRLLEEGAPVFGYFSDSEWFDIGEITPYAETQFHLLEHPFPWMKPFLSPYRNPSSGVYIAPTAHVPSTSNVTRPALVAEGAMIECENVGPQVIIGPRATIHSNRKVERTIVWPGMKISASHQTDGSIWISPDSAVVF